MITIIDTTTATLLRSRLLELARRQEQQADEAAVETAYWMPKPPSVYAHRAAAQALRAEADLFIVRGSDEADTISLVGRAS